MFPIIAKDYIKNLSELKEYECKVCFEVDPTIMRCKGPCKATLCLKCATTINYFNPHAKCPQRCSQLLRLQPIPNIKIQFKCSYSVWKCKQKIEGIDQFIKHCSRCEHIAYEAIKEQLKKEKFICDSDHSLIFLDDEFGSQIYGVLFAIKNNKKCVKCKQFRICRAYCKQCSSQSYKDAVYCNQCRPLPCTQDKCPLGHQFVKQKVKQQNFYCDLCGFKVIMFSNQYYHDEKCNFCFCGPCYKKLSDFSPLIPLKSNLNHLVEKKRKQKQCKWRKSQKNNFRLVRDDNDSPLQLYQYYSQEVYHNTLVTTDFE